jgi:alpha-1,3-glucan synthase
MMRARSAKQRFPVAQWVEDLDTLQSTAIKISEEENYDRTPMFMDKGRIHLPSLGSLRTLLRGGSTTQSPRQAPSNALLSPVVHSAPRTPVHGSDFWTPPTTRPQSPTPLNSPLSEDLLLPQPAHTNQNERPQMSSRFSTLSYHSVSGGREDFALQKVDPSFTDANGVYLKAFEKLLDQLSPKSSESLLCIEENLIKSEKNFFADYRDAKMGKTTPLPSRAASTHAVSRPMTPTDSFFNHSSNGSVESVPNEALLNQFALAQDYKPPTGLKRILLYRVGDWPIYSILLTFGQIIAANSYQVTLLIGEIGETAIQLYVVATIYAVSSIMWWLLFRRLQSVYCLSIPFAFYGAAFFLIAMAPFASSFPREVSLSISLMNK